MIDLGQYDAIRHVQDLYDNDLISTCRHKHLLQRLAFCRRKLRLHVDDAETLRKYNRIICIMHRLGFTKYNTL